MMAKIKKITVPGFSVAEIEVSTLDNTTAMTYVMAALRDYSDLVITAEFTPSIFGGTLSVGNALTTITFPDSGGSIALWCDIKEVSSPDFENNTQPTFDVTFKVTNRNGSGVETIPAFSA